MSTELLLVEGVSDVQFISYYLQNMYDWKHEKTNALKMEPMDSHEHIENLCKDDNHLILCGVGGNGRFKHFVDSHRINEIIIENEIQSVMVATDRDDDTKIKILRSINSCFKSIKFNCGKWTNNSVNDSFGQNKNIDTYLLIVPESDKGALEKVLIDALKDMPVATKVVENTVFKNLYIINTMPSYYQKYKDVSVVNNYSLVASKGNKISFVPAGNPFEVYNTLEIMIDSNQPICIAPLCTKPISLGICMYALEHDNVRIIYPYSQKSTGIQSREVHISYIYSIVV